MRHSWRTRWRGPLHTTPGRRTFRPCSLSMSLFAWCGRQTLSFAFPTPRHSIEEGTYSEHMAASCSQWSSSMTKTLTLPPKAKSNIRSRDYIVPAAVALACAGAAYAGADTTFDPALQKFTDFLEGSGGKIITVLSSRWPQAVSRLVRSLCLWASASALAPVCRSSPLS